MKYNIFSNKHLRIYNYLKSKELSIGLNIYYGGPFEKSLNINIDLIIIGIAIEI